MGSQSLPPGTLRAFPAARWKAEARFYRVAGQHADGRWLSPWWFCTDGGCRFDLPAGSPRGTLYAATDDITGVVEVIGNQSGQTVTYRFLESRQIYELAYDSTLELADFTSSRALGHGVTNSLSAMPHYEVPQSWAAALDAAGFDGIRYIARHATDGRATAIALFDRAGSHDWPVCGTWPAASPEIVEQLSDWGIGVAAPPRLSDLEVIA